MHQEHQELYFYIPKELMSNDFSAYSVESKLLFGMLLTNSTKPSSISETAKLIEFLGEVNIKNTFQELLTERGKAETDNRNEGNEYV